MIWVSIGRVPVLAIRLCHVDFTANDWFYSCFFGCQIEIDNAIHGAVIGDSEAIHAQFLGPGKKLGNAAHAVEQAVLGMNVEMSEFLWHF